MIAAPPTTTTLSIWIPGWPVRESESKMSSGAQSASADRWFNAVCSTVNKQVRLDTFICPWLVGRPKKLSVVARFVGVPGEAKAYERLTKDAVACAYGINKRSVSIKSSCEPGEPGAWLDISEVG